MKPFLLVLAACQGSQATTFPPGLEPFEDDPVPPLTGPPDELLRTASMDSDYIHVYGRGDILVPIDTVFGTAMNPDVLAATCSTTSHSAMVGNEPDYEFSVLVHYVEDNVLTVEWDDQWRFGVVVPRVRHAEAPEDRREQRSSRAARARSQLHATDDPNVTELEFVEHLDAIGGEHGRRPRAV